MRVLRGRHLGGFSEAPPGANRTGPPYVAAGGSNANFDTNMVIILAALLCALIFALGLNSIVRCALRCGRRLAFETPEEASTRLAATGLKRQALRRIPVSVYGEGADIPPATGAPYASASSRTGRRSGCSPSATTGSTSGASTSGSRRTPRAPRAGARSWNKAPGKGRRR